MSAITKSLGSFWIFHELPESDLAALAAVAVRRTVRDGTVLFRRGDPTPGLHLVLRGAIKIYSLTAAGEERIIDLIGRGGCCGEMGIIDGAPAAAWGETLGPTELWVIPAADLERLMLDHSAFCRTLCRVVVGRLRQAGEQLEEAIRLGARTRVLRHLVRLIAQHGEAVPGGLRLRLRLTHAELGLLAGTSRETVTRTLVDLQERRAIRLVDRQLEVIDLQELRALAGLEKEESEVDRPQDFAVR